MRTRLPLSLAAAIVLSTPAVASADFVHTVMAGESLTSIAAADGLRVDQLAAANGLSPTAQLTKGSTIQIPPQGAAAPSTTFTPAAASANFAHTVTPGESLTSIAAANGLSVDQLAAANGLSPTAQLITGSTIRIPSQGASASAGPSASTAAPSSDGDGDSDGDVSDSAAPVTPSPSSATSGSYVVQPGDTLTAIATRAGTSVAALAAANGLNPNGVLLAGSTLNLSGTGAGAPLPTQPPAVGTTVVGRMTWFGGPNDPNAQGVPASGLGWLPNGMSYYNEGSLGHSWVIKFPWGETLPMTQIDIGPAPWTGNPFDLAYSALPSTPYNESTWPNPVVTGTYEGP
jgi:LysM repeat protein